MAEVIVSRESIARRADEAARTWVQAGDPQRPLPANPFCEFMQPAHHREWNASLERSLQVHCAPEAEGSA